MGSQIGDVFREARNRRKVDLSEVEAETRIRIRYLRAIENEEWDVLPGGVYTRAFIRTYASFLGLDGERLAEDYRNSVERSGGSAQAAEPPPVAAPSPPRRAARPSLVPPAGWLAVVAVLVVASIAIVALPIGGGAGGGGTAGQPAYKRGNPRSHRASGGRTPRSGVSVRLAAKAEVWVCMTDAKGRRLVDGQILEAGAREGPFHSGSFTVSFGNGEVSMIIDGKQAEIAATSSPIGYSIDPSGRLTELSEAERPTCA